MGFTSTPIKDLWVFEPRVFEDSRGYFFESFNKNLFSEIGVKSDFVQDNQSFSLHGTLRGLHFQTGDMAQAKLVRVLQGCVLDVALDLRPESTTFGQHFTVELSAENKKQLFVPRGFAHGFVVLSETAEFFYKVDNFYAPKSEGGILWSDPELKIDWQVPTDKIATADKDKNHPTFSEYIKNL